jgi:class 3 adenylate cyclase
MLGLADPGDTPLCRAREVDFITAFAAGVAVFGEAQLLQFSRVLGTSAAALAEAAITLFAGDIAATLVDATDAEYGLSARDAMLAFEGVSVAVDVTLRLQFELALARLGGDIAVDELTYAIAFVDVVGSTEMAGALEGRQVAAALRDFDRMAAETAGRHDVRLVKLIGDGAMLAARAAGPLAQAVSELVPEVGRHDVLRAARGGLTFGSVAAHDGDYYGQTVNLASRAAGAAAIGEVLVDAATAAELPNATEPAGTFELKGFAEPVALYRLTVERTQP